MNTTAKIQKETQNFITPQLELNPNKVLFALNSKREIEYEKWKDIPKYKGYYQVSNFGRVKSLKRTVTRISGDYRVKEKILKQYNSQVYFVSGLKKQNKEKKYQTHQLVAIAFLNHKPCGTKIVVDHIDNNPLNNRLDNLQLISNRYNSSKDKKGYTSSFIGVSWKKECQKWRSSIYHKGKNIELGLFDNEIEASKYYKNALKDIKENKEIKTKPIIEKKTTTGYKGITKIKNRDAYQAIISHKGRKIRLGYFKTPEEGNEYYQNAVKAIKNGTPIIKKESKKQTSNIKGISYRADQDRWKAYIDINKKRTYLGSHLTEQDAIDKLNQYKLENNIN